MMNNFSILILGLLFLGILLYIGKRYLDILESKVAIYAVETNNKANETMTIEEVVSSSRDYLDMVDEIVKGECQLLLNQYILVSKIYPMENVTKDARDIANNSLEALKRAYFYTPDLAVTDEYIVRRLTNTAIYTIITGALSMNKHIRSGI